MARTEVSDWPSGGLEAVPRCPICKSDRRVLLYEGLTDRVFFTAPGRWTLHGCAECGSAYLDPRPSRETFGLAYANYYTHDDGNSATATPLRAAEIREAIRNGYLNAQYGYDLRPASRIGPLVARLLPKRRSYADHFVRHLQWRQGHNRLLDVGCGSGAFLAAMRQVGWNVQGIEPDEAAAEAARRSGIGVVAAPFEEAELEEASFDAITLNHVIEHLHDPVGALRRCRRLLVPGGTLWLATPNLDASGRRKFGPSWIGFDPPRHLVLFTRSSLLRALERTDLVPGRFRVPYTAAQSFSLSAAVEAGRDPSGSQPDRGLRVSAVVADQVTRVRPSAAEELILTAAAP